MDCVLSAQDGRGARSSAAIQPLCCRVCLRSDVLVKPRPAMRDPEEYAECVDLIPRDHTGALAIETSDPSIPRYFFETSSLSAPSIETGPSKRRRHMTAFTLPGTWRNPHVWSVPGQLITLLYTYWDSLKFYKGPPQP
jgi:hypothetical protein